MQHGVYVPIGPGIHMSTALFDVLTKNLVTPTNVVQDTPTKDSVEVPPTADFLKLQQRVAELCDNFDHVSSRKNSLRGDSNQATKAAHEAFPENSQNPPASSHSSVGAIPKLISSRQQNSDGYANIGGLMRAFSHPSAKFKGSRSESENLGTCHQQFMNVYKTFSLTQGEDFCNLYILFKQAAKQRDSTISMC